MLELEKKEKSKIRGGGICAPRAKQGTVSIFFKYKEEGSGFVGPETVLSEPTFLKTNNLGIYM